MSTTMGACFGGCTALVVSLIYYKIKEGKYIWDLGPCCNGALTGESCWHFLLSPFQGVIRAAMALFTGESCWH